MIPKNNDKSKQSQENEDEDRWLKTQKRLEKLVTSQASKESVERAKLVARLKANGEQQPIIKPSTTKTLSCKFNVTLEDVATDLGYVNLSKSQKIKLGQRIAKLDFEKEKHWSDTKDGCFFVNHYEDSQKLRLAVKEICFNL